jgi:hypothetical protein
MVGLRLDTYSTLIKLRQQVANTEPLPQFSVSQTYHDLAGIHGKPSEYPPQEEVDKRRYHYRRPKILMPAHVFLHFLRSPRRDA